LGGAVNESIKEGEEVKDLTYREIELALCGVGGLFGYQRYLTAVARAGRGDFDTGI
jgi:hypothetical protein